jgi:A/G-specific adenine glycosylase
MNPKFTSLLLKWNREKNNRSMPWKGEKDPYKIWLSEIILQQTRVEQGLSYYNTFIKTFPTVQKLAAAPDEQVFKIWEGLGYYSRCRNLLAAARYIVNDLNGKFPDNYEAIQQLKGVGPYTAAAISSFAFNEAHAVVDGNVFRVLARVFGISTPVDSTKGKQEFNRLAGELLDKKQPGIYNQAIMDFGAVVCKPAAPLCTICPIKKICVALEQNTISRLPVKEKKIQIKTRWFYYLVLEYRNEILVKQRTEKDIWQDLYEFILLETAAASSLAAVLKMAVKKELVTKEEATTAVNSALYKQQLSHQLIAGQFIHIKLKKKRTVINGSSWIKKENLTQYAFPGFINQHVRSEAATISLF